MRTKSRCAWGEGFTERVRTSLALPAFFALLTTTSMASDLLPLKSVMAQETSGATFEYALQRCTAVFLSVASQLEVDGGEEFTEEVARYRQGAAVFFTVIDEILEMPTGQLSANIREIGNLYIAEIRANYFATGNRFIGVVADDIEFCNDLSTGQM